MREWDPIGISDVPQAADEYDNYVGEVYVILMDARASKEEIYAYLYDIAANHMGLSAHSHIAERCENAAEALITLRPKFETH